jgi:hypothetical protein
MENKTIIKQRLLKKFTDTKPEMVAVDALQFYLGRYIDGKLFIKKENLSAAFKAFKTRILKEEPDISTYFDINSWTSLDDVLHDDTMEFIYDKDGNVIDIDQGGDLWGTWILKYIPDFVESGSYFVIVDDEDRFWQVVFKNNQILYFKQK